MTLTNGFVIKSIVIWYCSVGLLCSCGRGNKVEYGPSKCLSDNVRAGSPNSFQAFFEMVVRIASASCPRQ